MRRKRAHWCVWPVIVVVTFSRFNALHAGDPAVARTTYQRLQPALQAYCTGCHGGETPEAKVQLEYDVQQLDLNTQHNLWRSVLEKIRLNEMPPEDEPQPSAEERMQLIADLELLVRQVDCGQVSHPGKVTFRRLNRTEYNNTLRDLLGINFQPAADFPADDLGQGFDNIAEVLSMPPLLMEKYLDAAEQVIDQVLQDEALRTRLIYVQPSAEVREDEAARRVLVRHTSRAYRRPLTDEEIERLMKLYQAEVEGGAKFPQSLSLPLVASLSSPYFLFRIELDPNDHPDSVRPLNDYELATRLSYFLWSSMPDEDLFQSAGRGELKQPEMLEKQMRRMLSDPKGQAFVDNFISQWLELRTLNKITPDPQRFPTFNEALREDMKHETLQFAGHILFENRSILEFLDAKYTFINESLAKHYGIENVSGDEFRLVSLPNDRRGGVLTQASVLTLTSNPTRTSPVKRGKWILENILGAPPPPPPPNVKLLAEGGETELLGSLRERMEQHREDPSCAVCHKKMDALGFGFENFDAVGAWRDLDGRFAIDPAGALPGNQKFSGPAELRRVLVDQRRDQFVTCLTEKLMIYALGRELEASDRCEVERIVAKLAEDDYRFQTLILEIVRSAPFQKRGYHTAP